MDIVDAGENPFKNGNKEDVDSNKDINEQIN
jgi:hypothetical protein